MQARRQDHKQRHKNHTSRNLLLIIGLVLILGSLAYLVKNHKMSPSQLLKGDKQEQRQTKTADKPTEPTKSKVSWEKQDEPVKVPILMYHAIHDMDPSESASANLIVDPATFESHIKALAEQGYYFLSPQEAYKVLTENVLPNGNKKLVWLTFDDGDADFYSQAYPILKKYQAKGTNNIITSYVDTQGFLTLDQLKEMKKDGMSFQSHTVNHPDLSASSEESQSSELSQSKQWLDDQLNQETVALAYPSGRNNETTLSLAESSGYKLAVTTNEGLASLDNGLYSLNRVRILPTTTAQDLLNTIAW